jgi:diguanylate cyclase (GGDEF)-like protein
MSAFGESWSTQQLTEFLVRVSSFTEADAAIRGAVERAAEAVEAEVGAVVRDGILLASTGFPENDVPSDLLVSAATSGAELIELPRLGDCALISVRLEELLDGHLVLARVGDEAFSRQEANLIRGMGCVLTLVLKTLTLLDDERSLHKQSQEQARENARLLTALRERQRLLERLSGIQRSIVERAKLADVLDAIVAGAAAALDADAVGLRLVDAADPSALVLAAAQGLDPQQFPRGSRARRGESVAAAAIAMRRLVIVTRDGDGVERELEARGLASAMAAPVLENGLVIGALTVGTADSRRSFGKADEEVLSAFAEHASLALTDAKNYDAALHRALHDMLTGLPNRRLFLDRLEHASQRTTRSVAKPAVLFLDLDGFKRVNDSMGHAAGDELLIEVGERIRRSIRPGDTAARFGGDEFAVLVEDVSHPDEAVTVARRVMAALQRPFHVRQAELQVSASVGIALLRDPSDDLMRNADLAMYQAKSLGKNRYEMFDPGMHEVLVDRMRLEADLAEGVAQGQFELVYQPIVSLQSGAVAAVEALVRWRHPERGLLLPQAFIGAAEDTGLIRAIGRGVLEQACADAARWQERYPSSSPLAVSVNLSVNQLQHPALIDEVIHALESSGLAAESLILEITETLLMHDPEGSALAKLKGLGVKLAVDDFGTGYSSLQYLRTFPIDILKIAKSFIDGIAETGEAPLAQAIIDLGESLNLRVVAEGLEREAQVGHLVNLGCRWAQGYRFARPQPASKLDEVLESRGVEGWAPPGSERRVGAMARQA